MDKKAYSNSNESTNYEEINNVDSVIPFLLNCIDVNNNTMFKSILNNSKKIISKNSLESLFLTCLTSYKTGKKYTLSFISTLLSYDVNPNINIENNINEYGSIKTPLMLSCELSDIKLMKNILEFNCNVNFLDQYNRNALFYLNDGSNDSELISILIEKGINVNQQDNIERNTALHHLILNNKEKSAFSLINIGNANFIIKNKKDKCPLELIIEKWVNDKNVNYNEVKKIIKLINQKMSFDNNENKNKKLNNEKLKFYNLLDENNLVKLPLKNPKNPNYIRNNTFIKLKPVPILLLDTSSNIQNFNDFDSKQKIEKIKNVNYNKNYFLKLLQEYRTKLIQNNQSLKNEISEIKNQIEQNNKIMKEKQNNISNQNPKIQILKKEYKEIEIKISLIKEKLMKNQNSIETITQNNNIIKKFYLNENNDKNAFPREYITKQLQIDLIDFKNYVHNNVDQTQPVFEKLTSLISTYVKESLGNDYNIQVYGSRATKLCLPLSDIDIVISCFNFKSYSPLYTLYQYMMNKNFYSKINYIGSTQVPLIKIVTNNEYNNLSLDISLEDPKHYGVQCVNYIKKMMNEYEILTPMTLAVKNILFKASLNDPYKGGLSSYGVILLILNFINIEKNKGNDISIKNLGNLFYDFLFYYAQIFDTSKDIIDVNNMNDMSIYSKFQFQLMNSELIIIDPLNINNNVGKNTRQFKNIKIAFLIGYFAAKENCECGCHYQYEKICFKEDGCEHNILKRIFNSVKRIGVNDLNK